MEPVQGSISGHTQLDTGKTIVKHLPVHAVVVDNLLLTLWALTTTVKQHLTEVQSSLLFSQMTHCGMDKIAMILNVHAVILQISHGSARRFLSQLLTT